MLLGKPGMGSDAGVPMAHLQALHERGVLRVLQFDPLSPWVDRVARQQLGRAQDGGQEAR